MAVILKMNFQQKCFLTVMARLNSKYKILILNSQSNGGDVELQLNPQIRPDNVGVHQVNRANAITYTSKDHLINWYAHDPTPSTKPVL